MRVLQHGWGFDASFWEGWDGVRLDRGYFGNPMQEIPPGPLTLIAHSAGVHLVDPDLLKRCTRLVIISGFQGPIPSVDLMKQRLRSRDKGVLVDFYRRCFRPERREWLVPETIDWDLLERDLDLLGNPLPPCLRLHGSKDAVAPGEGHSEAGHCLPITHREWCEERIHQLTVTDRFSSAAATYHETATVPRWVARDMSEALPEVPKGPILEIGCGTGLLTERLLERYPGHKIEPTDLSPEMVDACEARLGVSSRVHDGSAPFPSGTYAGIFSSMTLQWLPQLDQVLANYRQALRPDGVLYLSILSAGSFTQWHEACSRSQIPFTGLALPKVEGRKTTYTTTHEGPQQFFRYLKQIGAGASRAKRLSAEQWQRLFAEWESPCRINHEVTFMEERACRS